MKNQVNLTVVKPWPILGLSGGLACGKTAASQYFLQKGAEVIDADIIAADLVKPHSPALEEIVQTFGKTILKVDGSLDRKKLNKRIFSHADDRKKLEAILHPKIFTVIKNTVENLLDQNLTTAIILSAPLLFESQLNQSCRKTLVISCTESKQIQRLAERDGFSRDQALVRIQSQWPLVKKAAKADWVVENNGTLKDLYEKLDRLWPSLLTLNR